MNEFHIWLGLFFVYCFLGWIWESGFRTVKNKKWINSGFLNGPWIPIYGFGAILILLATKPFTNNIVNLYIISVITATLFELIVGYIMEKIFHVRYWDYSAVPFNFHGYICLPVSLGWGIFAVILVYYVNIPLYHYVSLIPTILLIIINCILVILFITDTVLSTIQALNLKQVIVAKMDEFISEREVLNDKKIHKAEKIIKRNPQSLSYKHHLSTSEIHKIIQELKK